MRGGLPTQRKCTGPNCRAWSWELAAGKPCPYCHQFDRSVRFWIWVNRIALVGSLAAMASLLYLSGAT